MGAGCGHVHGCPLASSCACLLVHACLPDGVTPIKYIMDKIFPYLVGCAVVFALGCRTFQTYFGQDVAGEIRVNDAKIFRLPAQHCFFSTIHWLFPPPSSAGMESGATTAIWVRSSISSEK